MAPTPAADSQPPGGKPRVVIIGGGVAGLCSATELCRTGFAVTLLDKRECLGGRARSWRDAATGDVIDIGPHILLSEYRNMLRWLDRLGTRERVVWQRDKFMTLVGNPRPVDIYLRRLPAPLHFLPCLLTLPQVSTRDVASNRRVLWQTIRLGEAAVRELDATDAESWLRRMSVSERFIDWFWRSACMSIMNVPLERCSTGALLRFFRFMISRNDYRVGFAGTGLGELFVPPAVAAVEAGGGQVRTSVTACGMVSADGRATAVELDDGSKLAADAVVVAVPPVECAGILESSTSSAALGDLVCNLRKFEPSPYISSYLWFDRKLTSEKFWTRQWSPDNLNYDSYELSSIRPAWSDRSSVIASNIMYSHRAHHLDDEDIVSRTREELCAFLPDVAQANILHARVHRIPMGIPAPYPGTESLRPRNRTAVTNLFLAGDWTATGLPASMESAVFSGFRAAEGVLSLFGRPQSIAESPPGAEGLVRLLETPTARRDL